MLFKLNCPIGPFQKDQEIEEAELQPFIDFEKAIQYEWLTPIGSTKEVEEVIDKYERLQLVCKPDQKRILCLFDYACNTGFATVSENIVRELKRHFGENLKMVICAINYHGDTYDEDENTRVYNIKKIDPAGDPFGRSGFLKELLEGQYDGVFIIQDLNVISANKQGHATADLMEQIQSGKLMALYEKKQGLRAPKPKPFKSVFYFPVDCGLIDLHVKGLDFFNCIVTYTQFGKQQILKRSPKLDHIWVIPHGNNQTDFYPLPAKDCQMWRQKYFGEKYPGQRFIITNINRNQPRKDIPTTIFGFIEAKKNWPKDKLARPFLYLHMNPEDSEGWDLKILMKQTDLVEGVDYMFPPEEMKKQAATKEFMNIIYNASDLFLTTTTGEGWGLSVTEAMATKTPVIAPDYSSLPEITDNGQRAWLLETLYPYCTAEGSMIRYQSDFNEVAEKIIEVALEKKNNTAAYQEKIEDAYEYIKSLDWSVVCDDWAQVFHDVFKISFLEAKQD